MDDDRGSGLSLAEDACMVGGRAEHACGAIMVVAEGPPRRASSSAICYGGRVRGKKGQMRRSRWGALEYSTLLLYCSIAPLRRSGEVVSWENVQRGAVVRKKSKERCSVQMEQKQKKHRRPMCTNHRNKKNQNECVCEKATGCSQQQRVTKRASL